MNSCRILTKFVRHVQDFLKPKKVLSRDYQGGLKTKQTKTKHPPKDYEVWKKVF